MRSRGLLFTAGAAMIGFMLLGLAVNQSVSGGTVKTYASIAELERAAGKSVSVAFAVERLFRKHSNIRVCNDRFTLTVEGSLPNNMTGYTNRLTNLKNALSELTPDTTISGGEIGILSATGVNITQQSSRRVGVDLPDGISEVTFTGYIPSNITSCNISHTPGETRMTVSLRGGGTCLHAKMIDPTEENAFSGNEGEFSLRISRNHLTIESRMEERMEYTLKIKSRNGTYVMPLALSSHVETNIGGSKAVSQVLL